MKDLIYLIALMSSLTLLAQDPQLTDPIWYLNYVEFDGEITYPVFNAEINDVNINFNNPSVITMNACQEGVGVISFIDSTEFQVEEYIILSGLCVLPETVAFEEVYLYNFLKIDDLDILYQYEIITNTNDTLTLIITNEDGYKGYYRNVFLNTQDNDILRFQMYPNPVENELNIKFQNHDFNLAIYKIVDVTGKQLLIDVLDVSTSNVIDVQFLKAGIYFISINDQKGKISTQQFIKK